LGAYLRRGDGRRAWAAASGGGRRDCLDSSEPVARPGQQARSGALLYPRDDACGAGRLGKKTVKEFDADIHVGAVALASAHCARPVSFTLK
jgi:hypothetical protein